VAHEKSNTNRGYYGPHNETLTRTIYHSRQLQEDRRCALSVLPHGIAI